MQCIRPLKAQHLPDYSGITFTSKNINPEIAGFQLPCRKCLPCRLNQAREKAIRCYHESQMHENNIFLTLTYDEQHLKSPKLNYEDFQLFMKRLRFQNPQPIPMMVTGEYGEQTKRPHFHALLFDYCPTDARHKYTSDRGDKVSTSENLTNLWRNGNTEYGAVTLDSANYVARYSAKKLVHGNDQAHDYHPIHKTSSKYGIGRSWIEKYYKHTFENGFVLLPNNQKSKIPRYYVDWAKKYQPHLWEHYVTQVQPKIIKEAEINSEYYKEYDRWRISDPTLDRSHFKTTEQIKEIILQQKFKQLQEKLKL